MVPSFFVALCLALAIANPPQIKVHTIAPSNRDHQASEAAPAGASPTVGGASQMLPPILSHGGPVMVNPSIHLIFYGAWNVAPDNVNDGKQIITDFANGLGASGWAKIATAFPGDSATPAFPAYTSGSSTVTGTYANVYSTDIGFSPTTSTKLGSGDVARIVQWYVQNKRNNVYDSNAIYAVITSSGVTQVDSGKNAFCSAYCGWHSYTILNNQNIKYAWVGNPAALCPRSCGAQTVGPNGNAGVDALVSVLAHELTETTTDPLLNAWYDRNGAENGDKCAWTFGAAQFLSNGAWANVHIGTRSFLIQRNLATNSKCYVDGTSLQQ